MNFAVGDLVKRTSAEMSSFTFRVVEMPGLYHRYGVRSVDARPEDQTLYYLEVDLKPAPKFAVGAVVTRVSGVHAGRRGVVQAYGDGFYRVKLENAVLMGTYPEDALTEYVAPPVAVGDMLERDDVDRIEPGTVVVDRDDECLQREAGNVWRVFGDTGEYDDNYLSYPVKVVVLDSF